MNSALLSYIAVVMVVMAATVTMMGLNRVTRLSNMGGWYVFVFFLTYILHPVLADLTGDFLVYEYLDIAPLEDQWVRMTGAVCLSLLCFGLAYRFAGRKGDLNPARVVLPDPVNRLRAYQLAAFLCAWGYVSVLLSGGIGGSAYITNDDVSQFGVANGNTFWLLGSDLFVSSGSVLIYFLSRSLGLSFAIAAPWLLGRIGYGYGRIMIIGHVMALLAVWGCHAVGGTKVRRPQLVALMATIVFIVAVIFPAVSRSRTFFEDGITPDKVEQALELNTSMEDLGRTTGDFAGFETTLYHLDKSSQSAWGTYYIYAYFLKPIPRMIWPGKGFPDTLAEEWFGIERDPRYAGQDAGCIGWAYQQWGWGGIIFEFLLTGWALRRFEEWKDRYGYKTHVAFGYAGLFSMVPQLGRDSLLYMIADRWLFAFGIPFALLWYFSRGRDKSPSFVTVMVRTLTNTQDMGPAARESEIALPECVRQADPAGIVLRVVLWQNMLSHLQSSHVRALAEQPGVDVTIVGLGEITEERKALGWSVPGFGNARTVSSPEMEQIQDLIRDAGPHCVHLMAGWRGLRLGRELLRTLRDRGARIGLLSEGADNRGAAGIARRLVYAREREAGAKFDFILAMGSQGADWFRNCGYPEETIFPYAYIVESPLNQQEPLAPAENFEITFIGQLVRRKGLDIALRALKQLPDSGWRLTVVGDGADADDLRRLTEKLALTSRVRFLSALPSSEALDHLLYSDLLVLPSRFDGWGAVVNEALMRGVPVVSSDRCGAKDLLGSAERGEVFAAGSVFGLARALERRMAEGKRTQDRADAIRRWSKSIGGEGGAQYVLDVIRHVYGGGPRPTPIWDHIRA